jgi:hypothetical protein
MSIVSLSAFEQAQLREFFRGGHGRELSSWTSEEERRNANASANPRRVLHRYAPTRGDTKKSLAEHFPVSHDTRQHGTGQPPAHLKTAGALTGARGFESHPRR